MSRLEGKRAVVTGAASGIGRASARLFASEGASVLAVDRSEDALAETVAAIERDGGRVSAMAADVANELHSAQIVETCIKTYGDLDVYFANAGISGELVPITEYSLEMMERVLAVNLLGPMLAIKHAAPIMAENQSGSIILTASVAGLGGNAGPAAYSATKAGVINLAKSTAVELIGTGVRVNAICPGLIETGMTQSLFDAARARGREDKIGQLNPLQRHGAPQEMAQVALFLASDEASYVNGHAIVADGGLTASAPFTAANVLRVAPPPKD